MLCVMRLALTSFAAGPRRRRAPMGCDALALRKSPAVPHMLLTIWPKGAMMEQQQKIGLRMAEEQKGPNLLRLALGAAVLAAAAVSVAIFVPRSRWRSLGASVKGLSAAPMAAAVTAWAVSLW